MTSSTKTQLFPEIQAFLREKISARSLQKVEKITGRFSYQGQIAIGSLLVFAEEAGKTDEALSLLEKFYDEHWKFQHPDMRGNPEASGANQSYLTDVYQQLGITPPWEKK